MSQVKVIESTLDEASTTEDVIAAVKQAQAGEETVKPTPVETDTKRKTVGFLVDIESKAIAQTFANLEDFDVGKMVTVLPKLMQHVEHYRNLSGSQKKQLVITMLKHIIDVTDGPGNDDIWDPILKMMVPSLIDTLITVNDGKLRLRKKHGWLRKLLLCCKKK